MRVSPPNDRRAFTLLEALVVLGVVGLLIAIAVPVVRGAVAASRRTACMANLKTLHVATAMHIEDHPGLLPSATAQVWIGIGDVAPLDSLARYLDAPLPREDADRSIAGLAAPYRCPSDRGHASAYGFSYYYVPAEFMQIEGQEPVSRRYMKNPHLVLFVDRGAPHPGEPIPPGWESVPGGRNAVTLAGRVGWNLELQAAGLSR